MSTDIVVNVSSKFTGKKAFKEAEAASKKLNNQVKSLAQSLGIAFSARAVFNYSKAAVKAFAADDKAAKTLSRTLDNLGLSFADPSVKTFIAGLENQYHVLDDLLRPAYQKLLTTTGDWKKSQDLLKTALDLSAMSGSDVVSVADDLSRAYSGNTKGLQKYGLGLTKAQLSAMTFDQILKKIAQISSGQAALAADTYEGKLNALTVAANNASEAIGRGLVTAISEASGDGGIGSATNAISQLSNGVSDLIVGFERLYKIGLLLATFQPGSALDFYRKTKKEDMLSRQQYGGAAANVYIAQAQAAADKKARANAAAQLAILNKQKQAQADILKKKQLGLAIDKANLALGKGSDVFNMDAIQVNAALISQAEQLGKATSSAQLLAIANDVARLNVKKSMYELEQAIASGDIKAIEAATTKLNKDVEILGALQNQKYTVTQIADILNALKPKELIDIANLQLALSLLSQLKIPSLNVPGGSSQLGGVSASGIPVGDYVAPVSMKDALAASTDSLIEFADAAAARANAFADLLDMQTEADTKALADSALGKFVLAKPSSLATFRASESASLTTADSTAASKRGAFDNNTGLVVNVTVQGSVLSEQDLVQAVQNAVQANNRYGNNLNVAGSL